MIQPEAFETLRQQLNTHCTWPSVYMFKFIIPADNRSYALLRGLFPDEARFFDKHSSGGKYVSITVKEMMLSTDEVIERYKKASAIEGVISI